MQRLVIKIYWLTRTFFRICWWEGLRAAVNKTKGYFQGNTSIYSMLNEKFPPRENSNSFSYVNLLAKQPKISIVMPVFNSAWLSSAVKSVLDQSYKNYELILVDDCSTNEITKRDLVLASQNNQVTVLRSDKNCGISGATNIGLKKASGDYIAFMDHDDLLHPDALLYVVRTMNAGYEADVYYTDEAIIDENDYVLGVMRKCQISMDLLLSVNVITHFCVMKFDSLKHLGELNSEFDGSQDHDLMIRALEAGMKFFHLPIVTYAWRSHKSATSGAIREYKASEKKELPRAYINGKKAIESYLKRNNISAIVTDDAFCWYRVKYEIPNSEQVAIIVPFKDKIECLEVLLESMEKTSYKDYVLYLVNNRSTLPATKEFICKIESSKNPRIKIINFDEPFNFSRLYNFVISKIDNEILIFLNNDMEIITSDWIECMLEHIYRPQVAAVGCRLLREDDSIQHAGMIFRPDINLCSMNLHSEEGYYTMVQRDVSGVTAACMMIRKSIFQAVGGFDEVHFPIGFSDSDLCLKLISKGYKIIYTPFAKLYHHESVSRKVQTEHYEKFMLFSRYMSKTPMYDSHYRY